MIDEKKLIDEINSFRMMVTGLRSGKGILNEYANLYKDSISRIIEEQPKIGEWIPVEKELPEESLNSVIGWDAYRERCVFVQYLNNRWILGNDESVKILAWMPVPKPYEPPLEAQHCTNKECSYNTDKECPAWLGCGGFEQNNDLAQKG